MSVPRRRTALVVTSIVAVVAIVVAAFVLLRGDGAGDGSAAGPGASSTSPTLTTSNPPTTSPSEPATSATSSGSSTTVSALAQLEPFFSAASRMDAQLRAAAVKINAAGPPWYSLSDDVAGAVRDANLEEVAETLPGGMPEPLLLSTMAVYHDLAARRAAMNDFSYSRPTEAPNESEDNVTSTATPTAAQIR